MSDLYVSICLFVSFPLFRLLEMYALCVKEISTELIGIYVGL